MFIWWSKTVAENDSLGRHVQNAIELCLLCCLMSRHWLCCTSKTTYPESPSRKIAQVPMLKKLILGNQASQSLYLCLLPTPHQAPNRGKRSGRYWTASLSHRPCLPSPVPSQPVLEESSKDQGKLESEVLCGLNSDNLVVNLYQTRCEPCWRVAGLL